MIMEGRMFFQSINLFQKRISDRASHHEVGSWRSQPLHSGQGDREEDREPLQQVQDDAHEQGRELQAEGHQHFAED
jgi:hypothetical protein